MSCETLFAGKLPSKKRIREIYKASYYDSWKGTEQGINQTTKKMKSKTFISYLDLIERYMKLKNKFLLDIGCATGFFIEEANKRGALSFGVELSSYAAKEASKKFPKKIFLGQIENIEFTASKFDAITMIDMIEHSLNPVKTLKKVYKIIKKGGYILLVTPNTKSFWAKLLGKKWTNFKEEHLYYFSSKSLRGLIEKNGFDYIEGFNVNKFLTLDYIYSQLEIYPTPILSILSKVIALLPKKIRVYPFPINTGDYLLLGQKRVG